MYQTPKISVSWGEVFDKITILQIKLERIKDEQKLKNIKFELDELLKATEVLQLQESLTNDIKELKKVNEELWDIEDAIRQLEKKKQFDSRFIELARNVYIKNDLRYSIKRRINDRLNSTIKEEKSYTDYK
ncbi:MAG: DUF6165 family protein [Desulfurella sp.]|uniref:Uncharacterized protein n=1 Tax=Desulfurella multipotens TaxID=79269 RepID=A0A1G6QVK8_9BACT|nr:MULTISPECIES: DUF6165 family protein [Desulfurella]PMP91297.1 MAG: hypothetical protein C0173_03595 [Desulfurella sp.]SDC96263.1 hypothetical protein SAMN05660835_01668 [Desulfurella multipotens]